MQGDIAEPDTAQKVVEQALQRFGRIDSPINNAGVFIGKPFTDYTIDDYRAVTAVNLAGFFRLTQRAIRQMVSQGTGHIVNISTSLIDHANSSRPSALAALTKGGLAAVVRSLAIEYASQGLRVNAVSLGSSRPPCTTRHRIRGWPPYTPLDGSATSPMSSTGSSIWSRPSSSLARSCTSTAVRPLVNEQRRSIEAGHSAANRHPVALLALLAPNVIPARGATSRHTGSTGQGGSTFLGWSRSASLGSARARATQGSPWPLRDRLATDDDPPIS